MLTNNEHGDTERTELKVQVQVSNSSSKLTKCWQTVL